MSPLTTACARMYTRVSDAVPVSGLGLKGSLGCERRSHRPPRLFAVGGPPITSDMNITRSLVPPINPNMILDSSRTVFSCVCRSSTFRRSRNSSSGAGARFVCGIAVGGAAGPPAPAPAATRGCGAGGGGSGAGAGGPLYSAPPSSAPPPPPPPLGSSQYCCCCWGG